MQELAWMPGCLAAARWANSDWLVGHHEGSSSIFIYVEQLLQCIFNAREISTAIEIDRPACCATALGRLSPLTLIAHRAGSSSATVCGDLLEKPPEQDFNDHKVQSGGIMSEITLYIRSGRAWRLPALTVAEMQVQVQTAAPHIPCQLIF